MKKQELLAAAISADRKRTMVKGAIMRLGSRDVLVPRQCNSQAAVFRLMRRWAWADSAGRVIEIYGPESGGKTTMTLHVIAEAQKLGGQAAFIDAEHALDPVLRAEARRGLWTFAGVAARQRGAGAGDCGSADPFGWRGHRGGGLGCRAGTEADTRRGNGRSADGIAGALSVAALRKLTGIVSKSRTCPDFINQIREKDRGHVWESRNYNGRAGAEVLCVDARGYPAHFRQIKEATKWWARAPRAKVVKNKVAAPFPRSRIRHRVRRRNFARR